MSYFQQLALGGKCFFASSAIAGVTPVAVTTAQVFGLWNPAGSGVNVVLNKFVAGAGTLGTSIVAAFSLYFAQNVGAAIGTGNPVVSFTDLTIRNALLGVGPSSKVRMATTATLVANPTVLMALPMAQSAAAAGPMADQALQYCFDGSLIIPPSTYIGIHAGAANTTAYNMGLSWAEIPLA